MAATNAERGRITARVPAHAQQLIELAAQMTSTTANQFVAQAALREAERIVDKEYFVSLAREDMENFVAALDNPPPINPRLAASLDRYLETVSDINNSSGSFSWKPRKKAV